MAHQCQRLMRAGANGRTVCDLISAIRRADGLSESMVMVVGFRARKNPPAFPLVGFSVPPGKHDAREADWFNEVDSCGPLLVLLAKGNPLAFSSQPDWYTQASVHRYSIRVLERVEKGEVVRFASIGLHRAISISLERNRL